MRWSRSHIPDVIRVVATVFCGIFVTSSCAVGRYSANESYPMPSSDYHPEGKLTEVFFKSSQPGLTLRRAYVYLPKDYDNSDRAYPVLYLLHGARGNENAWINNGEVLKDIDSLTMCGAMEPTIVVLPNMNQYKSDRDYGKGRMKGAFESLFEINGTVEHFFIQDIVNVTDSLFRTIPEKDSRAVAGLSIGGLQSLFLSANSPDTFGYVGMFSPMIHTVLCPGDHHGFYHGLKRKQTSQFSSPPELYILMIGRTDFFYPAVKRYCRYLDRRGYDYETVYSKGGHQWNNWTSFCRDFMTMLWK
ncbi:MAG: hypothetical protein MJY67_03320 [Bacteroidales bacterium]|nr:hypothetical protein [Bacteroidales bacterium]